MIDFTKYAFIFDMDGTLVDNMRFHTEAWQKMLAENDIETEMEEFLIKTAGKTNREIIPNFFKDATSEQLLALGNRKEELYRELFLPELKPVTGAVEFLQKSKKLGIKMAVATAAPVVNMEFVLDGLDLRRFFTAITTAAEISEGKPSPEIFLKSADKLGAAPENCLVFEDALNGFEAARRAHMKSVGIATVNSMKTILSLPSVIEAAADFRTLEPQKLVEKFVPLKAGKAN